MTVKEVMGNLLRADTEALVNTVNTVGVMGKGIALQFKKAYPDNFKAYERAVKAGDVQLGRVFVYSTGKLTENPKYIINFPTKKHWRSRARLSDIREGLVDLVREVERLNIESIAVPPLGCGLGGLDWADVRPMIVEAFEPMDDVTVLMFPPVATPDAADIPVRTKRPRLTRARAAILSLLEGYVGFVGRGATPIEVQKLAYLLERVGEPLDLRFKKAIYGPYSERLEHLLNTLDGHFITGLGDRSLRVAEAEPITVVPESLDEVRSAVEEFGVLHHVDQVLDLVEGFNSAYGTELLASVDWSLMHEAGDSDTSDVLSALKEWNRRKERLFTPAHVEAALDRLRSHDLVPG